jgi:hypothetical protein
MIGYQDKINQILRGAETIKNMNDDIDEKEFEFDIFREISQLRDAAEELEEVKLERDALWVKTQEDEREINDLRDINKQLRQWKEEALVVLNQWGKVSEYIMKNGSVEDIGKSIPDLVLKKLEVS